MARNIELDGDPSFPVCFLYHDRKRTEDHDEFLNFFFEDPEVRQNVKTRTKLKSNANIPIVTDREDSFLKFFKTNSLTKYSHFSCTNHIVNNAKTWVQTNLGFSEVKKYNADMQELVKFGCFDDYKNKKEHFEKEWSPLFKMYFDKCIHQDLQTNFKQLETKNFPVFSADISITSNMSEAFNSAFKRVFEAEKYVRTEHVLVALFVYQVHRLQEFDLAFDDSGDFLLKPELSGSAQKLNMPYCEIDFNVILKAAKEAIDVYEPKESERQGEHASTRQLANFVLEKGSIDFGLGDVPHFTIADPLHKGKFNVVNLYPNAKFQCNCENKFKEDCFHIIAAKTVTAHGDKINNPFKIKRLSLIQRHVTGEGVGGKMKSRPGDLDPSPLSKAKNQLHKSKKTFSKTAKSTLPSEEINFLFGDDHYGHERVLDGIPEVALKHQTISTLFSPSCVDVIVPVNNENVAIEILDNVDLETGPKSLVFDSQTKIDFEEECEIILPSKSYSIKDLRTTIQLEHNYALPQPKKIKQKNQSALDLFDKLLAEIPATELNPVTGIVSNVKLADEITTDSLLFEESINEFAKCQIVLNGFSESVHLCDTYYYSNVDNRAPVTTLVSCLEFANAITKKFFFVIMNTDSFSGSHWFLGIILFDEKTIVICDSLQRPLIEYRKPFENLFKIGLFTFYAKFQQTNSDEWKFVLCDDVARQPNTYDCGVYCCYYIKQILAKLPLNVCDHIEERHCVIETLRKEYKLSTEKGTRNCHIQKRQIDEILNFTFTLKIELLPSATLFNQITLKRGFLYKK